jgi:hypothetical protein
MTSTPIVIDTTAAPRFDLTVRNNADWLAAFTFYTAYSPTAPWSNVDPWGPSLFYQSILPATVVTYLGDLYVPSLSSPETWQSAISFAAEASNWVRVGVASTYASSPFDLTGCVLKMGLAQLDGSGNVAFPKKQVIQLSSDGSGGSTQAIAIGSPASAGNASLNLLAATAVIIPGLVYGYDMNILKSGATTTAMWGQITVLQGAT